MKKRMTEAQLKNIEPHKFKKGQSGNPKGRPKDKIKQLLREILPAGKWRKISQELTPAEITTIEKQILQLDLNDLKLIAKMEGIPAYLQTLARAVIMDMNKGKIFTVDKLRDRQFGTVKQRVEMDTNLSFTDLLIESGIIDDTDTDKG